MKTVLKSLKKLNAVVISSVALSFGSTGIFASVDQFRAGDTIKCFDDVSSENSTIQIVRLNPLAVTVRITGQEGTRTFKTGSVKADLGDYELGLKMTSSARGNESFLISTAIISGLGNAVYADSGDSRALDCKVTKRI